MDLWIRSQNRQILIKATRVQYASYNGAEIFVYDGEDSEKVGRYKTKERALEVLDEIQSKIKGTFLLKAHEEEYKRALPNVKEYFEKLNSCCIVTGDNNYDIETINTNVFVYEMPEK